MKRKEGINQDCRTTLSTTMFLLVLPPGPERRLVMVESKLIKCRMSQTIGGETTPFTYKPLEGIQSCTVFEVAVWADASYLCVGMPDKVVLLKYNPSLGMYCVRKVGSDVFPRKREREKGEKRGTDWTK